MTWQAVAAVLSVAALLAVTMSVRRAGVAWGLSAETQRKAVHVGVGVHAMLLPLAMDRRGFSMFAVLALGALLFLRIPRVASAGPGAAIHSVSRRSWGDVLFLGAVAVLFLRSAGSFEFYVLPLAVLTMADTAAALIGTGYGRRHFGTTARTKSAEGTVAFFAVTWMLSVSVLTLLTEVPRHDVIWLATVISAMTALVEADSWRGFDNIFIPLAVHVLLVSWDHAPPWLLGGISLLWLAVLVGAGRAGEALGMSAHAVRATFAVLFLTAGLAGPWEMAFPLAALAAHMAVRRFGAPGSAMRDTDFVVVLFLVGVAWMTVGALGQARVSAWYAMTFAAIAAGYASLAVPPRFPPAGHLAGGAAALAMAGCQWWFVSRILNGVPGLSPAASAAACLAVSAACIPVARLERRRPWPAAFDVAALASLLTFTASGVFRP